MRGGGDDDWGGCWGGEEYIVGVFVLFLNGTRWWIWKGDLRGACCWQLDDTQ